MYTARSFLLLALTACAGNTQPKGEADTGTTDTSTTDTSTTDTGMGETTTGASCAAEIEQLTMGVATLALAEALPSRLVVHGDGACPVLADEEGRVLGATAVYGEGRVLHLGHENLIGADVDGDSDAWLTNLARWVTQGRPGATIGVDPAYPGLREELVRLGFDARRASGRSLDGFDALITTTYDERTDEDIAGLHARVAEGAGIITGGHAWWWAYQQGADASTVARAHPANRLLAPLGINVTADITTGGTLPIEPPDALLHAGRALDAVEAHLEGLASMPREEVLVATDTVGFAARSLPLGEGAWYRRVRALLENAPPVVPTPEAPLNLADAPIEALVVTLASTLGNGLDAEDVFAVPSAFPGEVSAEAPRVAVEVVVDATYAGMDADHAYASAAEPVWRATGVYVPPGEPVVVRLPETWSDAGLSLRIGSHTDTLWGADAWSRHPEVSRVVPIEGTSVTVASGFGGPLYLRVPEGTALGQGTLRIEGGVLYPRFVLGETDPAAFLADVASADAPLTELESHDFVVTVPTSDVPSELDPEALMAFWDRVLASDAALAGLSERPRAERLAMDVQISAGWMHSGYPIMSYAYGPELLDLPRLLREGDWGVFHELGHNHQFGPANLPGTTECTVNLWSVHAMEEVVGLERSLAHPALAPTERSARINAYLASGRDFANDWNVWTCQETYLQLQERFGWGPFVEVHTAHRRQPEDERARSDQERIDDWVVRTSRATGHDLTDFYAAWGLPIGSEVLTQVGDLPPWTDHPLAGR